MSKIVSYAVVGVAGLLLAGGLAVWLAGSVEVPEKPEEAGAAVSRAFAVEGMHCQGCADSITAALTGIPGVQSAKTSFADKQAVVLAKKSDVPTEKIIAAIAAVGYQAHVKKPVGIDRHSGE